MKTPAFIKHPARAVCNFVCRITDAVWFVRRLGYPWREAWTRAGWWSR
jgi:hypothetical protein